MTLPTQTDFLTSLAAEECPICYEPFAEPIKTDCGHYFCMQCAKEWFRSAYTCPSCRSPLFQKPEDWEDSDEDELEDNLGEDQEAEEEESEDDPPQRLKVVPDDCGPLDYGLWWPAQTLGIDDLKIDMEDDVFRETLVDLCDPRNYYKNWCAKPTWDAPTLITRFHLRSQTIAAIVRLTPATGEELVANLDFREAMCWPEWAEASRYLLRKLFELWEHQPEQSAGALLRTLQRGWSQHLEAKGLTMPQFGAQLSYQGLGATFEGRVKRLLTRIVGFAQETAGRYASARENSLLAEAGAGSEDEDRLWDFIGGSDEDDTREWASDDEDQLAAEYAFHEAISSNAEDSDYAHDHSSTSIYAPDPNDEQRPLSEEAESLLQEVVSEVKRYIVTRHKSTYGAIARALIVEATGHDSSLEMVQGLNDDIFSFQLCDRIHEIVHASGGGHEFE